MEGGHRKLSYNDPKHRHIEVSIVYSRWLSLFGVSTGDSLSHPLPLEHL